MHGNHHITLLIMLIIIIINNNNNYLSSLYFDDLDYIPPLHQNEFRLGSIACLKAKHDLSSGKLVVISGPSPLQMGGLQNSRRESAKQLLRCIDE